MYKYTTQELISLRERESAESDNSPKVTMIVMILMTIDIDHDLDKRLELLIMMNVLIIDMMTEINRIYITFNSN